MTIKEFKSLTGLFIVTLSLVLLYSFSNMDQVEEENVYSSQTVMATEIDYSEDGEQQANTLEEIESESTVDNELLSGVVNTGLLANELTAYLSNYEVSSAK